MIVLAIALLVFGTKRLPEVARGIGRSVNAFKDGLKEVVSDVESGKTEAPAKKEDLKIS